MMTILGVEEAENNAPDDRIRAKTDDKIRRMIEGGWKKLRRERFALMKTPEKTAEFHAIFLLADS